MSLHTVHTVLVSSNRTSWGPCVRVGVLLVSLISLVPKGQLRPFQSLLYRRGRARPLACPGHLPDRLAPVPEPWLAVGRSCRSCRSCRATVGPLSDILLSDCRTTVGLLLKSLSDHCRSCQSATMFPPCRTYCRWGLSDLLSDCRTAAGLLSDCCRTVGLFDLLYTVGLLL